MKNIAIKANGARISPMPVALVNSHAPICIPGSLMRGAMRRATMRVISEKLLGL